MSKLGKDNPNYKTGAAINVKRPKWYAVWQNMKGRCLRKNHPKYPRYGGRGISICQEWLTVKGFFDWVKSSGYADGMSLDRIDNDGNYCPENCRWVTKYENFRRKSTTKLTFVQAQEIRVRLERGENEYDLAKEYGVVHGTIWFIKKRFTHVPDGECTRMLKKYKDNTHHD